jgi:gamma-glutamylcyclotransferase (GGCT)/AIG2-like uncharacterized protein YtfP
VPDRGRKPRAPGWSSAAHQVVDCAFFYGTLRTGQIMRSMIANHVVGWEPATAPGRIYAFPMGYPGLVQEGAGPDERVVGELVRLRDLPAAFALLDAYEGPDFSRQLTPTWRTDAASAAEREVVAWVYVLADPGAITGGEHIPGGDWIKYWETSEG